MHSPTRRFTTISATLAVAIAATFGLSGCFGNPLEAAINSGIGGVIKDATGIEVDANQDFKSVPKDFPKSVPLAGGDVTYGGVISLGGVKTWTVTVAVGDAQGTFDNVKSQLESAGFVEGLSTVAEDSGFGTFNSDQYVVMFTIDGKDGRYELSYVVSENKK